MIKLTLSDWIVLGIIAIYVIFPADVIPDFIPIVGWLDDIVAMFVAYLKIRD